MSGKAMASAALAIASVVLSCLALGAIMATMEISIGAAFLVMPILGATAVTLGVLALRDMKRSGGRITGRLPALIGLFVGLLSTVMQGALGIGALRTYMDLKNTLAPAMTGLFSAMDAGDEKLAAVRLTAPDKGGVPLERAAAVAAEMKRRMGACRGAVFDMKVLGEVREMMASARPDPNGQPTTPDADLPRPVRLEYEKGTVLALVFIDNDALQSEDVRAKDVLVVLGGGEVLPLLEDGPAAKIAKVLGLKVVELVPAKP